MKPSTANFTLQVLSMAAVSHNHAGYQARLDYVKQILADYLNLSDEIGRQQPSSKSTSSFSTLNYLISKFAIISNDDDPE